MKVLVTGAAGFIGYFTTRRLAEEGHEVVGIDNLNDYYTPALKLGRLAAAGIRAAAPEYNRELRSDRYPNYRFLRLDVTDSEGIRELFRRERFDTVCHLAAQAGVRYSLENPQAYIDSNMSGFLQILEACRRFPVRHLVYASSSSVYGDNAKVPFSEEDRCDDPASFYALTEKANEAMALVYAKRFGIPATGLRFFTVYGPWGRPDMAPILFARAICHGEPIQVFNHGEMYRDFTYVEDIVEGVVRVLHRAPEGEPPHALYNIGCSHPILLMDFIRTLERALGQQARLEMRPMQPGDVVRTYADTSRLEQKFGYRPATSLEEGIARFVAWFQSPDNPLRH